MLLFKTTCGELVKPLQALAGVIDRKNPSSPVSNCVLIIIKDGRSQFVGSDTELEMRLAGPALDPEYPADKELMFAVNHKVFTDLLKVSKAAENVRVDWVEERQVMVLEIGQGVYEIRGQDGFLFPEIRCSGNEICTFDVLDGDLRLMLQQTQYLVTTNDVRQYLRVVLMEIIGQDICAAGSDGCRLAYASGPLERVERIAPQTLDVIEGQDPETYRLLFAKKTVMELLKLLEGGEDVVSMRFYDNAMVRVRYRDVDMVSKLVTCFYPNFRSIEPKGAPRASLSLNRQALCETMRKVSTILNDTPSKIATFTISDGTLTIKANSKDNDKSQERFDVAYQGEEMAFLFKVDYIAETLNTITSDRVQFDFHMPEGNINTSNCKLKIIAPDMLASYYAIIMPFVGGNV